MFAWLTQSLWGSDSKKIELDGQFTKFDKTPSCVFVKAKLIVDTKVQNSNGDKLIQVINANESNDDEVSKYEFPIDETIHFSSVKNDGGHVAFCWRKPDEDEKKIWFCFNLAKQGNVQATAGVFKQLICELIYENTYSQLPEQGYDVSHLCGVVELPYDLETLTVYKTTEKPRKSLLTPQEEPNKKSPVKQSPVKKSPVKKKSPKKTEIPKPIYPELKEEISYTGPYKRDDEEEIARAKGNLFIFNHDIRQFVLKATDIEAAIYQIGEWKNHVFHLCIEKADTKQRLLSQVMSSEMQVRFLEQEHSIIWVLPSPLSTWSVVFSDKEEEYEFKQQITECLYEATSMLAFNELKKEDQRMLLDSNVLDDVEMEEDDGYNKDDFMDWDKSDDEREYESGDEEEEEEDIKQESLKTPSKPSDFKNTLLADSHKHGRTFVVRGPDIGVFKRGPDLDDAIYTTAITNVTTPKGKIFTPSKIMLHQQDSSLLLVGPTQQDEAYRGKVFKMDLERGKVVEEWNALDDLLPIRSIAPIEKYAQHKNQTLFAGLNNATIFAMDPRVNTANKVVGNVLECQSRSHPEYSCISTTSDGNVAVGSNKGVIRLFSGIPGMPKSTGKGTNPKSAKTLLPGFGDPIKGIDVTADGEWVLATCKTYLLVLCTLMPDSDKTGFTVRMGKHKPTPRRLQLLPEDLHKVGGSVDFTPARFNTGSDGEIWIVTSTGSTLVSWNFRKVKQNKVFDYTLKQLPGKIVTGQFLSIPDDLPGKDAPVVLTLEDDVRLEKRVYTKSNPYRPPSFKYK